MPQHNTILIKAAYMQQDWQLQGNFKGESVVTTILPLRIEVSY